MSKNKNGQVTDMVKQELVNWVNGMSEDELEIIIDTIPVEKCLERIRKELDKAAAFDEHLKDIMNKYGKSVIA